MEGHINGIVDSIDYFDGKCDQGVVKQYQDTPLTFSGMTVGVIGNVMTDLYGDPANSLIPFSQVLSAAREKVAGIPIDELIIAARRAAVSK